MTIEIPELYLFRNNTYPITYLYQKHVFRTKQNILSRNALLHILQRSLRLQAKHKETEYVLNICDFDDRFGNKMRQSAKRRKFGFVVAIKSNFKFSGERLNTSEVITAYKKLLLPEPELPTTSIFAATDKLHVSYSFFVFLPGTIIKSLPSCSGSFLSRRLLDFFSEFLSKKLLFYQSNSEQAFSLSKKAPT